MSVRLNEAALRFLLDSEDGPTGQEIRSRAERVAAIATENVSGGGNAWLNIDTGDLHSSIRYVIFPGVNGPSATIGTNATHRGFNYGGYWNENGRPWLSEALADVFP